MGSDLILTTLVLAGGILLPGLLIGSFDRRNFQSGWLLVAALLVVANDAALTDFWGHLPEIAWGDYNWQGKILALAISLAVAAHPAFGWRRSGVTLNQGDEAVRSTMIVIAASLLLFAILSLLLPNDPYSAETLAFQASMPGLEEEIFYRGTLLLALNMAFTARRRTAGVDIGWGALIATLAFGMAHGVEFNDGVFEPDWIAMAISGIPALILLWVRERTGSVLWPIILHNAANTFPLIL